MYLFFLFFLHNRRVKPSLLYEKFTFLCGLVFRANPDGKTYPTYGGGPFRRERHGMTRRNVKRA
jgi:hypothetical protein